MNIYKILTIVLAIAFLVSLGMLIRNWYVADQADKQFKEIADQVNQPQKGQNGDNAWGTQKPGAGGTENTEAGTESGSEQGAESGPAWGQIPWKNLDWEMLRQFNEDIYAWIYIPGTEVDYPIVQHPTDDSYYLNYNLNGSRGYPGCIYTELSNSKKFTDFDTVVYGHNMRDGAMFATLHYFESQSFFNNCPYIYVYFEDKVLVYGVFAAYTADDKHILNTNDFSTETGRKAYLEEVFRNGDENGRRRDMEVSLYSHILTLSTCIRGKSSNRYLVQAKLLNEEALFE